MTHAPNPAGPPPMSYPGSPPRPAATDRDLLPVVDEHDRPIDTRPRREVHLQGLRHRAVHVCVFDTAGRLWLQRRSRAKDTYGGFWDLSATGHVDPGESYDAAARRELREELGLDAAPEFLVKLPATARTGWEFHALYVLRGIDGPPAFNREEIEELRRLTLAQLRRVAALADPAWPLSPSIPDALPYLVGLDGGAAR